MNRYRGCLYGNGEDGDAADEGPGELEQGAQWGCLLGLDGSLRFFKNGQQHGPGYPAGSVTGPVVFAASLNGHASVGPQEVRILDAAEPPVVR